MSNFNPERLTVEYRNGVTATQPIIPRNHTLTHSDVTGELLLIIGEQFAWDNINTDLRDEVIGGWKYNQNYLYYNVYILIHKEDHDFNTAVRRNDIFRRELPLALTTIRYGDRFLFELYPLLDHLPINIIFMSAYTQLAKQENWGTFSSYSI